MILYSTVGEAYWAKQDPSTVDDDFLEGDERLKQMEVNHGLKEAVGGISQTIVVFMIILSTLLNLACWF